MKNTTAALLAAFSERRKAIFACADGDTVAMQVRQIRDMRARFAFTTRHNRRLKGSAS